MFNHMHRLIVMAVAAFALVGCGSGGQDLMAFLKKKNNKREWVKQCGDIPDNNLPGEASGVCWTKYERAGKKKGKVILFVGVRMAKRLSDQVLVFAVPRGVSLDKGMRIKFDNEIPIKLRYSNCDAKACYSKVHMTKNLLIKLKYSKRMVVAVMSRYNKAYGYRVPLFRFVYAYNSAPKNQVKTASR